MYDGSSSIYDGLLLTVQHRLANDFTLLTNYAWSKCITGGTDVGDLGGNTFQNPLTILPLTATTAAKTSGITSIPPLWPQAR